MLTPAQLLAAMATYRDARIQLLRAIGTTGSNRDPLGEFSEQLVAAVFGGAVSNNRNEPGWDVRLADGTTVQVKSLANTTGSTHRNMHKMRLAQADHYAIVVIDDFTVLGIAVIASTAFAQVGQALGKRGSAPLASGWGFTRSDWSRLEKDRTRFEQLGVQIRTAADLPLA